MDGTPDVVKFAETLEKVCVDLVEAGQDDEGPRASSSATRPRT